MKIDVVDLIFNELRKAELKHPGWPVDPIHAAGIMVEEAGEAMQAAIDYVYADGEIDKLIVEASQCGAMAIRLLLGIEEYKRTRAIQI